MLFYDRHAAGRLLVNKLPHYQGKKNSLVLGLARGGVVVAFEVAKTLNLPLNVIVPRKIGAPNNPELALGSIMENGVGVFNDSIIRLLDVSQTYILSEIDKEKARAQQRLNLYRSYVPLPSLKNHTIILVDDGIATGSTMLTSIQAMRHLEVQHLVVAVPVASINAIHLIEKVVDEVVCLYSEEDFVGVGRYYSFFNQIEDTEVVELLKEANA